MKRPNRLDWLVYWLFYLWWNPIFEQNQELAKGFHTLFGMNMTRSNTKKPVMAVPTKDWWK